MTNSIRLEQKKLQEDKKKLQKAKGKIEQDRKEPNWFQK